MLSFNDIVHISLVFVLFSFLWLLMLFFISPLLYNSINELFASPYYQIKSNTFEMSPPKTIEEEKQLVFSKIVFNGNSVQIVLYPSYRVFIAEYSTNQNNKKDDYAAECTFVNPEDQTEYAIRPAKAVDLKNVQQIELLNNNEVVQILNRSSVNN